MVGVPGRSKACVTCRRRKKGCDKKVPFCGQCLAMGIPCEGYERQQIWLNSEGSTQKSYTKSPSRSSSSSPSDSSPPAPVVILHDSLMRTARTQKFTGLFWSDYLSGGSGFSLKASGITSAKWMALYEVLSDAEASLQYVAMALSTATLGATNNDVQLMNKSQQAYGLAMQQMATSFISPSRNKDGILAAIQLMRVYEQLFGTGISAAQKNSPVSQIKGFRKHIDGETALILSRGPQDSWSSMGKQLLADGRLTLINAYISRRKRSPYSQGWKQSQLWRSVTTSPLNQLIDILVEVPALLEDLDIFREAPSNELYNSILTRCHTCEVEILALGLGFGESLTTYDYTYTREPLPIPKNDDDLAIVYLSCYYWMTCFFIYSTMGFCELESMDSYARGPILNYPSQRIAMSYAYKIAHAIHLVFEPPAGTYSSVAAFFLLGTALRYLIMVETHGGHDIMSKERLLLVNIFTRPFLGSFVGRFLQNLQVDDGIDYGYPADILLGMRGIEYRARVWWCGMMQAGLPEFTLEDPCYPSK
ncbi:hypothetical protein FOXG_16486 [Fusarium oxysporum f. sp. lycopersici 4287]|uniref:Zn(2)-C6 fungal-type domain-containing protein n=2 Tax=Fusarium oxysporum TaxID=5507 RepID=A0A0J9W8L3_FUSO4|nr:hypothetical protein FOXG_16486 [Fusarium oxysporum f. sp. lycopersici 4287]EXK30562.1 hypothetical protein FOMG_13354 [Fusarium oxysporum f. sp. melonis 26406]KAJ9415890.1 hypothetical protein QL093DRAFT_1075633 [Fusarium oxysporum]KNB19035.1 hypothetical protein FOXG_16486 [Fusarium oxysporum f. sp. lycopersici 4287]